MAFENFMKLTIKPLDRRPVPDDALFAAAEANCEKLRSLGYDATIQKVIQKADFCQTHLRVARGSTVYVDATAILSIRDSINLSRFTERATVQHALDDMATRMIGLGWNVTTTNATIADDEKIAVEHADGTTEKYFPTNAEMVRLRHDLDHAETHWIVGDNMSLFMEVGWEVQKASDGDYYILYKPSGGFDTIAFGRVDQAKYRVEEAKKALAYVDVQKHVNEHRVL